MTLIIDQLFDEIKGDLLDYFLKNERSHIDAAVAEIKGDDWESAASRSEKREALQDQAQKTFLVYWNNTVKPQIIQQSNTFYNIIKTQLLQRHPWLKNEGKLPPPKRSLKDDFLFKTVKSLLFDLLENKPVILVNKRSIQPRAWTEVLISDTTQFTWKDIDETWLTCQIQGYPLSNASFYDDRPLPSYLESPFTQSIMRYDLYRLLKNAYKEKFKPKELSDGVCCTRIAPLHHTELTCLSANEWNHLESILVNIGTEETPEWVLLNKAEKEETSGWVLVENTESKWTFYAPPAWERRCRDICRQIPVLQNAQIHPVTHSTTPDLNTPVYAEAIDWHAVLLSRILPWRYQTEIQDLQHYRSTLPIPVLFQNTLELSCLAAQEKFKAASQKAFAKREPLSKLTEMALYSAPTDPQCLLSQIPETSASIVVDAFDKRQITYDHLTRQFTIQEPIHFVEVMKLAYYHRIPKLVMIIPPPPSLKPWFEYNLEFTILDSPNEPAYEYPHACAARNRFLERFKPDYLSSATDKMEVRHQAWKNTGAFIYDFFKRSHPNDAQSKNIAEMGAEGLEVFFRHLNELTEPANLSCALDLDSGKSLDTKAYVTLLKNKIQSFTKKPLFSQLELILPKNLDGATEAFSDLILALNNRREIDVITLRNPALITATFLDALIKFAATKKICLQIKIPEWDDPKDDPESLKDPKKNFLKAEYRRLQNTILGNIRQARVPELNANTASIHTPPPVAYPLKHAKLIPNNQSWQEGVVYTLASAAAGIQQQAQQEVAQEVQQEAEQQSQPKTPVAREITEYTGDENQLITRDNLQAWEIHTEDFSSWVGSDKNAASVIQKIDKAALNQIKAFPALFKFGIDGERTPGFRLYYSRDNKALILTYDEALVEQDIVEKEIEKDPFAIQMNDNKPATPFCGDYRQLAPLADSNQQDELTLWRHLATEIVPTSIQTWLRDRNCHTETSESFQLYSVNQTIKYSSEQPSNAMSIIQQWSKKNGIQDEAFLSVLFDQLTSQDIQAFGQLFYHYDTEGNHHWLNLVHKLYTTFPKHFAIYQQRLLNPMHDWSACLEKNEVEALTASMQKLGEHPEYQAILWKLVDVHGETMGRMRYAEVWRGYDKVIDYINAHDLKIDVDQFMKAIEKYEGAFNATQFLRRLHRVLQHTGNRQDSTIIQQEILDNLSEIDWHEDGFYYACVHEHYRYWDKALMLYDVNPLNDSKTPTYTATWDEIDLNTLSHPVSYTLRYAAQKLKLNKLDFNKFKVLIHKISEQCPDNQTALMRILTASIALGLDTIDGLKDVNWATLNDKTYATGLQLINQHLQLDSKDLVSQSYHVRINDLPILLTTFHATQFNDLNLDKLNAFGRALQSYSSDKQPKLQKLIQYGRQHGFEQPLITAYPWLVDEPIENPPHRPECMKFYKQLRSIDFLKSRLPSKQELTQILEDIHTESDRHRAVTQLIKQRCFITDQDADFRPLEAAQMQMADELYLSKTFQKQNRSLLKKLFAHLAIKQEGNVNEKIKALLTLFSELDRKNYYDELGQLLGLLVEQSQDVKYYSVEQLTIWLETVFDETSFKSKPYPVAFIKALLTDALKDETSGLLNRDLHQLKTREDALDPLKKIIGEINLSDLPDHAKKALVKCAIQFKRAPNLEKIISRFHTILNQLKKLPGVTHSLCDLITKQLERDPEKLLDHLDILEKLTAPYPGTDEKLKTLWERNQIKLLEGLKTESLAGSTAKLLIDIPDSSTRMILIEAFAASDDQKLIESVQTLLNRLNPQERLELAAYYVSEPKPTLKQLSELISHQKAPTAIIHHFERVMQAAGKRYYSFREKDATNIQRVLSGFKLKQQAPIAPPEQSELLRLLYYINTYSQVMRLEGKSDDELLKIIATNKKIDSHEAKAQILACMREILLRKTGKWANHTQMIALLYSVLHNDDNLLHQIRMGEGKSIITLMRVAYRAFHGEIVDVFSSKESLSLRDHQESLGVLDAFGIRHSHITANSEPEEYYNTVDQDGVGAIHYATIGNWSLFLSGVRWNNKDDQARIDTSADNRVAFLDEGDYIMRFESTLFNFSDQTGAATVYNFDAWAYQIAYQFYLAHQEKFKDKKFTVSEEPDLKDLYSLLQEGAKTIAPEQSEFFKKYLASGDDTLRNQQLVRLLTASHLAQTLKEGVNFCVMSEQKKISDTATIDTRCAKVMINNQVYHGSTYSDLVQQFLHVRLNHEAVEKSQEPNFFIEPESEIALSLNALYVLKNYYKHIEACTGTAGDKKALQFYKDELGIYRVVKLPTHEEVKTEFLPPIYAENEAAQIAAIVASIKEHPDQPILITCEDDEAVERLGKLIQAALLGESRGIIIDTSATGVSEADVLKKAGERGALTISARLGRGSDIRPYKTDPGLRVIRTYPATPDIVKQEEGRPARNGAEGVCQDIINYEVIENEWKQYQTDERLGKLLQEETEHLDIKLKKHEELKKQNKKKWEAIRNSEELKEKYLHTRTLQTYKYHIKEEHRQRMRRKEALLIEGSAEVMAHLRELPLLTAKEDFKKAWKACMKSMEIHGTTTDPEGEKSREILNDFYKKNGIQPPQPHPQSAPVEMAPSESEEIAPLQERISFHQNWVKSICESTFNPSSEVIQALYGETGEQLDRLSKAFQELNVEQLRLLSELVNNYPACHTIACGTWVEAIKLLVSEPDSMEIYATRLKDFFTKSHATPNNAQEVSKLSHSFITMMEGAPDFEFIKERIDDTDAEDKSYLLDIVPTFPKQVVALCKTCMNEEDIVFFLNILNKFKSDNSHELITEHFINRYSDLKASPAVIRPLIAVLAQVPDKTLFKTLEYTETTPALLHFLRERSVFETKDYHDLQNKINRIQDKNHQLAFLTLLTSIPPYISVREILKNLSELPGKHSFDTGHHELTHHIKQIQSATMAFNEFLFDNDLISNQDSFETPTDKNQYDAWQVIFSKLPLNRREKFFTSIKGLYHLGFDQLKNLAERYAKHQSNQTLQKEIHQLNISETNQLNATTSHEDNQANTSMIKSKIHQSGGSKSIFENEQADNHLPPLKFFK